MGHASFEGERQGAAASPEVFEGEAQYAHKLGPKATREVRKDSTSEDARQRVGRDDANAKGEARMRVRTVNNVSEYSSCQITFLFGR